MARKRRLLTRLSERAELALIQGARSAEPVSGLSHRFYKYPARFSPIFARAAIECFTRPGDLVLDPHVGGGTTLVEALATGRRGVGIDISSLAEFVSQVKTTVLTEAELESLSCWTSHIHEAINTQKSSVRLNDYAQLGYYKHLNHPSRWRLRKAIEQGLASAVRLGTPRLEAFGRCVILRTAQLALDGRSKRTTVDEFRKLIRDSAAEMLEGAKALQTAVSAHGSRPSVTLLHRSAAGLEEDERLQDLPAPRLVLTSPPYPGVHVLYHRWQVDGRKEAAVPFMIANRLDGAGSSYYTMGDRKYPKLKTYFDNIRATMSSVATLADSRTVIVQMVAFSEPRWQLPEYLQTMKEAGLSETFLPALETKGDGRLWRNVPGRRWYSDQRGATPGSQEVVLFHRKATDAPKRRAADVVTSRPRPSV